MKIVWCLLLCFCGSLAAEVVSIDGEEHLILPADLVLGGAGNMHRDLRHAKPYELTQDGDLELTDVYKRIYRLDAAGEAFIKKRLELIQKQYIGFIYQNGQFTREGDDKIIVYEGMAAHMDPIIDRYILEVDGALNEKQKKIVKFFDLYDFENFGQLLRFDEGEVKIVLQEPREEREVKDPEIKQAIETLRGKVDEAKKLMRENRGAENNKKYYELRKELQKMEAPYVARSNYTIKIMIDDQVKSQRGSNKKQASYILYDKAFELHLRDQEIK